MLPSFGQSGSYADTNKTEAAGANVARTSIKTI